MPAPAFPAPKPWSAQPMDPSEPTGAWQVRASSLVGDGSPGAVIAMYLMRQDAEDVANGVNKLEAERRMNEEAATPS